MTPEIIANLGGLGVFAWWVGSEVRLMRRAMERMTAALVGAYPQIAESIPPPAHRRGRKRRIEMSDTEDTEP